ncbi:alkylation response protein AidB-like acyl-CoA dehydrogenase [Actinocorallia herbida]|uniref:Alkylation response protein AidB-like acyl-CoA dehydrogenase n=1 Tax=Actinocorallia herbida TaxID=58109 RepID=A0A3N1CV75_9ACTN|nr:acyl-CoA dehydrogenase [Actinocorallia herbida]ROO85186.1 alkylation response protein AidB-like acyl-CoA dehydrogenase [Actinocorallia herbida]
MDIDPSEEQRQLIAAFAALYGDLAGPEAVRAAEPGGHDAGLWRRLVATGAVEMALPETAGGFGASLLDLALVAEQHGRHVAPAPLVEAQVAARLLARLGTLPKGVDLADLAHGHTLTSLAVRPSGAGHAGLVPAAAVADDAVVLCGDRLLLVELAGRVAPVRNLGCLPLADVDLADRDDDACAVLAEGPEAVALFADAVDEWRVLTAAALCGLAARALEIGVAYVKERKAFGRVLGEFQAVAHRLADRAAEVDGAELLAREAAWAAEAEPERAAELAAMALAFAAETARDATHEALHFHGGYGFMLEYPIQLYYRRARAWAAVLESPAEGYRRVADLAGAGKATR